MVLCPFPGCTAEDGEPSDETPLPFTKPRPLVAHLEAVHGLHVRNLHHMYFSLQRYLERYADMMRANNDGKPVADGIKVETKDNHLVWTIDPELCVDDMDFRRELQREKLNEILQIQEKERHEEGALPRKCLFCKLVPDNRHMLFRHMFQEHGFNIGLPDNLVEVDEFLGVLEQKLANRQCLYCEKIFTTPAVLRKHMRKKKHFKISARNRIYDRYYVINYLEPGLNWETLEYEKYESDEERRGDDDWNDWDEPDREPTQCLFCSQVAESPEMIVEHMTLVHQFDLVQLRDEHDLDFYKTIALINYVREQSVHCNCMGCGEQHAEVDALVAHMTKQGCFAKLPDASHDLWTNPKYLFPTVENDPLLMWVDDVEELEEVEVEVDLASSGQDGVDADTEESDDDVEVVLGGRGEQVQSVGRVVEGSDRLFAVPKLAPTAAKPVAEHPHTGEKKHTGTTTTITVVRPRRFSEVEGVVPEKINLSAQDVPELDELK